MHAVIKVLHGLSVRSAEYSSNAGVLKLEVNRLGSMLQFPLAKISIVGTSGRQEETMISVNARTGRVSLTPLTADCPFDLPEDAASQGDKDVEDTEDSDNG